MQMRKYYNDNNMGDEEYMLSPQSSTLNTGYNPSLNNNFKRRVVQKPLQIQNRRSSRLNYGTASGRNESSESNNKIPSIHRNLKNMNYLKQNKVPKLFKNGQKSVRTSRNSQMAINQSYNGVPKLKEKFQLSKNDMGELDGLNSTVDLSGSLTQRNLFLSPNRESDGNILSLQFKINQLKEQVSDRDSQIIALKRSVKMTNINELKKENETLYEE